MKLKFLFAIVLWFCVFVTKAQRTIVPIEKHKWDIGFGVQTIGLQARLGYFFTDKVWVGLNTETALLNTISFLGYIGGGPSVRYYVNHQRIHRFFEASFLYGQSGTIVSIKCASTCPPMPYNGLSGLAGLSYGASFRLGNKVRFESKLRLGRITTAKQDPAAANHNWTLAPQLSLVFN